MSKRERHYCDGSCIANDAECEIFKAMSKQSPSDRQAERERAKAYNTCPDCQRSTREYGGCVTRGGYNCIRVERDLLRLELSKAQGQLHEAWEQGYVTAGLDAPSSPRSENPFPKPEKKESE